MEKFTIKQALKVFGLSEGKHSAKEVKLIYRRLSMRYHPDREEGNAELMKAINQAWNVLSVVGDISASDYFNDTDSETSYSDDVIIQQLKKAIEAINTLINPDIEICGVWLYLHSDS
ncbi:Chaperone protein DnaJ (plasmid) [Piscirickettsia salmonis]|uniref:J domain-containing protein n=1 Tax=Piscirickettsia salmonis TaxID=1238 RepID=UPI0012BAD1F4|nr:J domain-containing protein [Piscirickettsia salmonis]QGP57275.1 Chaperone protein DnaJ [Piscirickettsia salmonis]QGP61958.1 Chaperone protein DnaJ [Piscirickettsia salmonis]QGP66810.1 Chaperone protein DnaJ [Piscirickettsia salmonis]